MRAMFRPGHNTYPPHVHPLCAVLQDMSVSTEQWKGKGCVNMWYLGFGAMCSGAGYA